MPVQTSTDWIQRLGAVQPGLSAYIATFGVRGGPNSDGVLLGAITPTAPTACFKALTGGTVFTDYTTAAGNATAADVTFDFAAVNDALYVGYTKPFSGLKVVYGGGTAGVYSATLLWEFRSSASGGSWVNLATSNILLDSTSSSGALKASAATRFVTWNPPAVWQETTVNGVVAYWVRLRCSAFTSNSTAPVLDQVLALPQSAAHGPTIGVAGTLQSVDFSAQTLSTTTNDSILLLVTPSGTYKFTATKGKATVSDTAPALTVAAGDQLAVQQLQQDGGTEFGAASLRLLFQPTQ